MYRQLFSVLCKPIPLAIALLTLAGGALSAQEYSFRSCICLAWICRDQLQGMGLGQMEQLLQECGCGPELLAACL